MRPTRGAAALLALLLTTGAGTGAETPVETAAAAGAHFVVADRVVSPGFGPFAATVESVGAGARLVWAGAGFEPVVMRTRWRATEDAPDRIVAPPEDVAWWDTLAEGALDGARVDIYRVVGGRLDRVRADRIAPGGHAASGWQGLLPDGRLLAPAVRGVELALPRWRRPGAPAWIAVQAVGRDGTVSTPSAAVRVAPEAAPEAPPETSGPAFVAAPAGLPRTEAAAAGAPAAPPAAGDGGAAAGPVAPEAPQDLAVETTPEGILRLSWTAASDPGAGWRVLVADMAPEAMRGYFGRLEGGAGGAPIRAGDMAILSKTFEGSSRKAYHTARVWEGWGDIGLTRQPLLDFFPDEEPGRTWRLVRHEAGTPVPEPGETYLELELDRGAAARVGAANHAGPGQHWYEVLEPGRTYLIEVWARADRPKKIAFRIDGPYAAPGMAELRPKAALVGPAWTKLTARFTPLKPIPPGEDWVGWMGIETEGPGRIALDNLRIRPEDTDWLNLDAVEYGRLAASGVTALRTHGLAKTFRRTYDLGQLTAPAGVTSIDGLGTLPQTLGIAERAGIDPWLQIEPHLTPEEWLGLVEYLAAPAPPPGAEAERPWAARRAAEGRVAPWSDAFGRIYLELGNETWNAMFAPWSFPSMPDAATGATLSPGTVYGLFQEHVIRTLRASPWWAGAGLEDKVVFTLGGWSIGDYGRDAALASPSSELLTIAAYNGGWDAGKGPPRATPQGFSEILNDVTQSALPDADRLVAAAAEIAAARGGAQGPGIAIGTYEAGPGYALDGLNGDRVSEAEAEEQERVMKSVAAGTATLDAFLARAERGFGPQNFFTFGEGRTWRSHARRVEGGAAHPAWALLGLAADVAGGEALAVDTLATPRADLPATAWRPAAAEAPLIGAYAAREADRLTLTVVSRRVPFWPDPADDGTTAVIVDLPFARAARVTRHRMDGPLDATNIAAPTVGLVAEPAPAGWFADGRLAIPALPPGQAEIYVFEGIGDG